MPDPVRRVACERAVAQLLGIRKESGRVPAALLVRMARELGVGESTLWRWVAAGRVLEHEPNRMQLPERALACYFENCGNIAAVERQLRGEGIELPSRRTLQRAFKRELTRAERAFAKEGEMGRRRFQLYRRRESLHRNELWEGDHMELPIEVIPPRGRKGQRPWFTAFIDTYSRAITGWAISLYPSQAEILAALISAVLVQEERGPFGGIPGVLRWDNGLDWVSDAVTSAAIQLGSLPLGTNAYSPHEKGKIERVFRTIQTECIAGLPFYTDGPRRANGALFGPGEQRMSLQALVAEVERYVDHYNLERSHSALDGQSPLERWQTDATPIEQKDREELRGIVLPKKSRKVLKDGIHFERLIFFAPELNNLVGETVEIRYMPHDLREVEVLHDGEFVCAARPQKALTEDEWTRFLAKRKQDLKRASSLRRAASRRARSRLAPITDSDRIEEAGSADASEARRDGGLRTGDLRGQGSAELLGLDGLNEPLDDPQEAP